MKTNVRDFSGLMLSQLSYFSFPGGSDSKESACSAREPGSIPQSGRSPGEGHGNPHPYYCLENPMDGGAGLATVYKVTRVRHDRATSLFKSNVVDIEV